MDSEIDSTKQFFKSHHITLSDEWLESCIEWYREENPNLNYSRDTLHQKVYEQWLLLDLREAEVPILPTNLSQTQKIILNGIFSLQLMYIIDMSQPKLTQLQKIRNMMLNEVEEEYKNNTSTKRMLQLVISDGVQEVEAIEYKPIPTLNLHMVPGIKLKIIGPVTVRRGQLMLESRNIEILGGEVEDLLVSNAAENILAKELNLPLNPQPNVKLETPTATNASAIKSNLLNNNRNTENQYIYLNDAIMQQPPINAGNSLERGKQQTKITSYINNTNSRINNSNNVLKQQPHASVGVTHQNVNIPDCDRIQYNVNENERLRTKTYDDVEEMMIQECDDLLEIEKELEMEQIQSQACKYTTKPSIHHFESETDGDIFEAIDIDSHLDVIDQQLALNIKVISINELLSNNITCGKFTIRAKFKSVSGKLTINNSQQWSLRLIVTDDTGELELWVDTDVITKIIDCSPATVAALKEDIRNKKPGASNLVMQKINELRSKIEQLDGVVEITFNSSEQYPTITALK